jgi:hypothetical protein
LLLRNTGGKLRFTGVRGRTVADPGNWRALLITGRNFLDIPGFLYGLPADRPPAGSP